MNVNPVFFRRNGNGAAHRDEPRTPRSRTRLVSDARNDQSDAGFAEGLRKYAAGVILFSAPGSFPSCSVRMPNPPSTGQCLLVVLTLCAGDQHLPPH